MKKITSTSFRSFSYAVNTLLLKQERKDVANCVVVGEYSFRMLQRWIFILQSSWDLIHKWTSAAITLLWCFVSEQLCAFKSGLVALVYCTFLQNHFTGWFRYVWTTYEIIWKKWNQKLWFQVCMRYIQPTRSHKSLKQRLCLTTVKHFSMSWTFWITFEGAVSSELTWTMLDINITWIFHDLSVGEYETVIAQKVESGTLLNPYMHIQIYWEASARIHKSREQYVTIE